MFKKIYNYFAVSYSFNKSYKKYLFLTFFIFLFFSIISLILSIVPLTLTKLADNYLLYPSRHYKSYVEYRNFPGNQINFKNLFGVHGDEPYLPTFLTDGFSPAKGATSDYFRGFNTYNPTIPNTYLSNLPMYNEQALPPSVVYSKIFHDLVNYYYGINFNENKKNQYPSELNDGSIPETWGIFFGTGLEYNASNFLPHEMFQALSDYNKYNQALNGLKSFMAFNLGIKTRIVGTGVNQQVICYGGQFDNTILNTMSQVFSAGVYQQLPYYLKSIFYTNKFSLENGLVPFNPATDEKYTYLNGYWIGPNDKHINLQTWGLQKNSKFELESSSKKSLNDRVGINWDSSNSEYQKVIQSISKNKETVPPYNSGEPIPIVINKTLAEKYHLSSGDTMTYHVNVPRILYKENNDGTQNKSLDWTSADPKNYFFHGQAAVPQVVSTNQLATGLYYKIDNDSDNDYYNTTSYLTEVPRRNSYPGSPLNPNGMLFSDDEWNTKSEKNPVIYNNNVSTYNYKIVGVADNTYNQPLIYMNKSFANILNGYVGVPNKIWPANYYEKNSENKYDLPDSVEVDDSVFNGKFTTNPNPPDVQNLDAYSAIGDYTSVGLNGTELAWNEENKDFERNAGTVIYDENFSDTTSGKMLTSDEIDNTSKWVFSHENTEGINAIFLPSGIYDSVENLQSLLNKILAFVFIISILISIVIIIMSFRIIIYQYRINIGVYKAFGYKTRQIFEQMFSIYGLIACLSFIIGIPISYGIGNLIAYFVTKSQGIAFYQLGLRIEVFIPVIISLFIFYFIVAFISYLYVRSIKPIIALREK